MNGSAARRAETALEAAVAHLLPVVTYQADARTLLTTVVSPAVTPQLGFRVDEFLGDTWVRHLHDDDRERAVRAVADAIAASGEFTLRYRLWNKQRSEYLWIEDRGLVERDAHGRPARINGVMVDVTESQWLTRALERSEERYRKVFHDHPFPLWVHDAGTQAFLLVNDAACAAYGYGRAEFLNLTLRDLRASDDAGPLAPPVAAEGRDDSVGGRHRRKDGSVFEIEAVSHPLVWDGLDARLVVAIDMTKHREADRRAIEAERRLKESLVNTIQVLVAAVEQRDPYTAGHQRRVSRIAAKVAEHLGLPPEQADGVRLAGLIHDVGKISIPSEILSLPRALNDIERALVSDHVEIGYQLLKDIPFPWPIADVVRQHHERLDGSGYPRGLRGDEIRLESRIIAAADVLEAMAAHRPWRPSLGLEFALADLRSGAGRTFDADVVAGLVDLARAGRLRDLLAPPPR